MYRPTSRRRTFGAIALAGALALSTAACGSKSDTAAKTPKSGGSGACPAPEHKAGDPVKAGFVYVGPINDGGWTTAHNKAREEAQKSLGDKVITTYKENVPEGSETEQVIRNMVRDGNQIIFATSFGFGDAMAAVAKDCPQIKFEHATGITTADNLATYFASSEDTIYLTGISAGKAIDDGATVGFVAPVEIPEVIRHVNAFALGVRSVNPTAKVKVIYTGDWFAPTEERKAAETLIKDGAQAIASGVDGPAAGQAAMAKKLPFIGYDSDQSKNLSDVWLTASLYHWGGYYTERIQAVIDGTWKTHAYYGGLNDDIIGLAPFGDLVDKDTRDLIAEKEAALRDGSFYEFTGPLTSNKGEEKVAAGKKMTLEEILTMEWYVEGIEV